MVHLYSISLVALPTLHQCRQRSSQRNRGAPDNRATTLRSPHQDKVNLRLRCRDPTWKQEAGHPTPTHARSRQRLTFNDHQISVRQRMAVVKLKPHDRHFISLLRDPAIRHSGSRERLNPGLLKPGHISPMPHHSRVVGVLWKHTLLQSPTSGRNALSHHGPGEGVSP